MVTKEDVEKLKKDWIKDPCWDLWESGEEFKPFEAELRAYQETMVATWRQQAQKSQREEAEKRQMPLELYQKVRECELTAQRAVSRAQDLLLHYFEQAGVSVAGDGGLEICKIVDEIVHAAVAQSAATLLEAQGSACQDKLEDENNDFSPR